MPAAAMPGARPAAARKRTVVTPEGLALPFTLASRGSRVGGYLLDMIFMMLALAAVTIVMGLMGLSLVNDKTLSAPAQAVFALWIMASFVLRNGWFALWELSPRGATPGKRIVGIRVAARDGGRLSAEMVIARNLLRDVEIIVPLALIGLDLGLTGWMRAIPPVAWLLIFGGLPLFNADRLRCGDVVAGTWVVEAPRSKLARVLSLGAELPTPTAPAVSEDAYHFNAADLAVYGEYECQALERVLRDANPKAMAEVATTICAKIHWSPPGEAELHPFLTAYYTQLRARLEGGMRMGRRKVDKHTGEAEA